MFDNDDDFPLQFLEDLGEHTLSDDIRKALVWASIQKFLVGTDMMKAVDQDSFPDKTKNLARSIVFHGPLDNLDEALERSRRLGGVIVQPQHIWTEDEQPVWIACLAN